MNTIQNYLLPLSSLAIVLLLVLFYLLMKSKKKYALQNKQLKEYEEKIKWLREIAAENEHRHTAKEHENQKQIMALEHKIEMLETQVKEGTKNQVVSKIEALQDKRKRALERADIAL